MTYFIVPIILIIIIYTMENNNNINIELISLNELIRLRKIINDRINILTNNIYIKNTPLTNKTLKSLMKSNIVTLTQLKNTNINTIPRIGSKGRTEIKEMLETYNK